MMIKLDQKNQILDEEVLKEIFEIVGKRNASISNIEEIQDAGKFIYHFNKLDFEIEYKKFNDLRYPQVLSALLESFLSQKNPINSRNISIALIEIRRSVSGNKNEAIVEKIENFLERYNAKELNWLMLDSGGNLFGRFKGKLINKQLFRKLEIIERGKNIVERNSLYFSPVQQWLAKILILNGINKSGEHQGLWPIKYNDRIQDYKILSKISGVSESSCFNFIKLLEEKKFFSFDQYEYQFKNLDAFFELWKGSVRSEKKEELFLVPKKPFGDIDKWYKHGPAEFVEFCEKNRSGNFVMGGHLACRALGISFSNNNSSIIYASSVKDILFEEFMSELKLRPSEENNGEIRVVLQKKEMPILKIDEISPSRHVFADPIQLMFDVEYLGGRGKEQSDYIFEKVLSKHIRSSNWQS